MKKKGEYRFQEVFFNGHPANKQNPHPPPRKQKEMPPSPPPENPPPPPPPPVRQRKKPDPERRKRHRHILLKLIIILAVLLILSLAGGAFIIISRIEYSRDMPDHEAVSDAVGELKSDSQVYNIMIFGQDKHADNENGRADTMLMLSIDKKHHALKQISFLRDLYLPIFHEYEDKLNAAFAIGGAKLAVETIEYNFKIKIDNYIIVDFESFVSIVNGIGGIDIQLTGDEIDYIDWQSHRNKQVESEHELSAIKPAPNELGGYDMHLNGRQALWHARNRGESDATHYFSGSDFDRTKRQREVINAILDKIKSTSPVELVKTIYEVAPMITTDMNFNSVLSNGIAMIRYLGYERMEYRVPQSFNYTDQTINGADVLVIDNQEEEANALYEFIFNKEPDPAIS